MPEGKQNVEGRLPALRAALKRMEAGDSFTVEDRTSMSHAYRVAQALGCHITVRKINGGWRIWRKD
jgi:hypothetical protein